MDPLPQTTGGPSGCCDEYARAFRLSRRGLLGGALLGGSAMAFGDAVVNVSTAQAAEDRAFGNNVLVVLSMRGGCDGLSLVVPHADPAYWAARPKIAVPKGTLWGGNAQFGLHPSLKPLDGLWTGGKMAVITRAGLPARTRSHFEAIEKMEDADATSSARVGWISRLIGQDAISSPVQAISLGAGTLPTSMAGPQPVTSVRDLKSMRLSGDSPKNDRREKALRVLWGEANNPFGRGARQALTAVHRFKPTRPGDDVPPQNGAKYPDGDLGRALAATARVIRADIGANVISVDHGEWDMHVNLGTVGWGSMEDNTAEFAGSLAAFFTDLGAARQRVTVVTISEFGRRVAENGNSGADHGYGNVMFVLGAGVRGHRYYGGWSRLQNTPEADVPVANDYRTVLAEVARKRLGADASKVFPGWKYDSLGFMY